VLVVVQDNDQILVQVARLIQPFERQAGAQAAVADDRHHLARRPLQIFRNDHSQGRGDRRASMARAENIVFALLAA